MKKIIVMIIVLGGQLAFGMDVPQRVPLELVLTNDMKKSLLIMAAETGGIDQVRTFLDYGFDVNGDFNRKTPLVAAAENGHVEVVRLLLDRGADINAIAPDNNTALIVAAHRGQIEVVRLLLDRGADVNVASGDGSTALMYAASFGTRPRQFEIVLELLTFIPVAERKAIRENVFGLLSALKHKAAGEGLGRQMPSDIRKFIGQDVINKLVEEQMPKIMAQARLLTAARSNSGRTARDWADLSNALDIIDLLNLDNPESQAILQRQVEANIRRIINNAELVQAQPQAPQPYQPTAKRSKTE